MSNYPESNSPLSQQASSDGEKLQSNALGLLSMAALTAAYMGPALSIYALFGPMSEKVGSGTAFVMLIAMGITLLSAISFGMLAKEMPSAGGVYAWSSKTLGESAGLWVGLTTIIYFAISLIFPPIIFGQYLNELLQQCNEILSIHLPVNEWTWLLGAVGMMLVAALVVYRGIVVSSHMAATLLVIEIAVIVALAITMVVFAVRHGTFTLKPMTLAACKDGWRGVAQALPFALMCMVCDAAVPAAEETRNAKWTIPIAVVLTCLIVGLWYVCGFTAFSMVQLPGDAVDSSIQNPVAPMVDHTWGKFKFLVSITAMTASLGAFIPIMIGSSRMIFAMAREGKLPRWIGKLHGKYRSPWNALHVLFIFTILGSIPPMLLYGWDDTANWWGGALGWYIAVVYLTANLVNIIYYARFARQRFNPILNALIPGIAILVQLAFIWKTVVVALWQDGARGKSAQGFIALVGLISLIYAISVRSRVDRSEPKGFEALPIPDKS